MAKATKGVDGKEVFTLSAPLDIDGIKYTTLNLDLESLTGADMDIAEIQVRSTGYEISTAHELCKPYLLALAARACKVNVENLKKLPIKDASKITLLVQSFLLN